MSKMKYEKINTIKLKENMESKIMVIEMVEFGCCALEKKKKY